MAMNVGQARRELFNNYYEILQVSPNAEPEIIERVYRVLAKRYHPDNNRTGDPERFGILTEAYRVLSDSQKRSEYNAYPKAKQFLPENNFIKTPPSNGDNVDQMIYQAILSILYMTRKQDISNPGVGIVDLEKQLGCPEKYLEFHIWYLKEKGWIQRIDNGGYAITASGVDTVIERDLLLKKDRFLPIKK